MSDAEIGGAGVTVGIFGCAKFAGFNISGIGIILGIAQPIFGFNVLLPHPAAPLFLEPHPVNLDPDILELLFDFIISLHLKECLLRVGLSS